MIKSSVTGREKALMEGDHFDEWSALLCDTRNSSFLRIFLEMTVICNDYERFVCYDNFR